MAKELFIMFVYDTQRCQKEEDDPQDALLYFHPSWVSDHQQLALCGQLMGVTQFFLSAFRCPRIISLSSGKFVVQQCGRYILTVGTDRNIPDWILENRANALYQLLQFYHKDFDTVCSVAAAKEYQFADKLNEIFETYIPIVQFAGNIFANIPIIQLPKSASNMFLEAMQILHCCQEKDGVLGGMVLYHNKVVATQLGCDLTKQLVSTDPYRIKIPAESVGTPFHLPLGVQLMQVYISGTEYNKLMQAAASARTAFEAVTAQKSMPRKVHHTKLSSNKEQMLSMKRDTSKIFTVPEEKEGETEDSHQQTVCSTGGVSGVVPHSESRSFATGTISECSTPAREHNLNKILHARVVSICRGSDDDKPDHLEWEQKKRISIPAPIMPVKGGQQRMKVRTGDVLVNDTEMRSLSLNDLHHTGKTLSRRMPMRYYSIGLPRLTHDMYDDDDEHSSTIPESSTPACFYNTIADPLNPFFRNDSLPISHSLFSEYLSQHYQLLDMARSPTPGGECQGGNPASMGTSNEQDEEEIQINRNSTASKQEQYRRSLSLPLKTVTSNGLDATAAPLDSPSAVRSSRTVGSLQLTPLMSKLSLLAMEEKTSGFCSRETTPGDFRAEFPCFTGTSSDSIAVHRQDNRTEKEGRQEQQAYLQQTPQRAVLYVCGHHNMVLLLVLEEQLGQDPELIHHLWETSVSSLSRLEAHLRQCLEHFLPADGMEPYSFLCMDPQWDMMQRAGPWAAQHIDVVAALHKDFTQCVGLTEVVVRCEDNTVYGYQCGRTEVFYQQPAGSQAGLPTPSDLMGVVPLKARRRLERDHGIILL